MQIRHIAAGISMALGGALLLIFVDGAVARYTIAALTVVLAALYGTLAARGTLENYPAIHQAAATYSVWTLFSATFGLRALQVVETPVVLGVGLVLSIALSYIWVHGESQEAMLHRLLSLLTFEFFIILMFAPASFMVLGALLAIGFMLAAHILELVRTETAHTKSVITAIAAAVGAAVIFAAAFRFTL